MTWTGDPVWLADVLRAEGLRVVEYPGWRQRGHGDFGAIWGIVVHHTGASRTPPSEIAKGLPQLKGPLSQLHLAQDGTVTVVAVGVAWHAGVGSWPGLPEDNANWHTIGIEAANNGTEGWSDEQYGAYVGCCAAILRKLGFDAAHVIGHKEWAGLKQGKWDPGGIDMDRFRADVQRQIDHPATDFKEDDMPSAEQIAAAVWAQRLSKPGARPGKNEDGVDNETAGNLLAWGDHQAGKAVDQLGGPGSKDRRDAAVTGYEQLGGRSVVDALAAIGEKLGLDGFKTKAGKS